MKISFGLLLALLLFSACRSAPDKTPQSNVPTVAVIHASNMSCENCATAITQTLQATAGVRSAKMSFKAAEVTVEFDASTVTAENLVQTINQLGYPAHLIEKAAEKN